MKKIMIFYASYGGGHLSAANSIKQYLDENYSEYETKMVDCMLYVNKPINKLSTDAYKEMAKKAPWAWGKIYYYSEKGPLAKISNTSNELMASKLLKLLNEYKPDIVISTHPFASQMVSYLKKKHRYNCKLATIMTDFAPHDQWLVGFDYTDYFFVSHNGMKKDLENKGIPSEKVFATGIPLSNRFLFHYNKTDIKKAFNLAIDKKTILFFGGGEFGLGKDKTVQILKSFIDNAVGFQIVAISGKNEKMKERFESLVKEENCEQTVKVLGFTNKVPELMSISDLVVTKPGGLTVTESLASGLPIVVINPIPGQEEENAEFLENSGVAIWIKKKDDPNEDVQNLLSNTEKLQQMKIKTKLLAKKHSTQDICRTILNNNI